MHPLIVLSCYPSIIENIIEIEKEKKEKEKKSKK